MAPLAPVLAVLPADFRCEPPLSASLRLATAGRFEGYYASFDQLNPAARIVLVGITPGRTQALEAIATARQCLRAGMDEGQARARAKTTASFAGPLRTNLVAPLDHVGLAAQLGLPTTAPLRSSRNEPVQFTSALR